jgi:hypothetical protein
MEKRIPARLTPRAGRKFACTVAAAFLVFGAIAWCRHHNVAAAVCACLGAVLLFAGLILPGRLTPLWRAWMGLAYAISRVTTPLFMGLVYFLIFTPMGLVKRWMGDDPLIHEAGADGYWVKKGGARSDMERQF